jgi:hypothetical protein
MKAAKYVAFTSLPKMHKSFNDFTMTENLNYIKDEATLKIQKLDRNTTNIKCYKSIIKMKSFNITSRDGGPGGQQNPPPMPCPSPAVFPPTNSRSQIRWIPDR